MALRPGICTAFTVKVWETLKKGGVTTVVDFLAKNPEDLSQDLLLPFKDLCSIRRVLLAEYSPLPINGAKLYETALSTLAILPTGFENFDQLLDGGLYTGELTEIAGDSTTGKTRVCLRSIAATVSSGSQRAIFIDTNGSFDCRTLVEGLICCGKNESELKSLLEYVTCIQALEVYKLMTVLHSLHYLLTQQSPEVSDLKMIVVDNFSSLINPLMGDDSAYRQGILSKLGMQLKQLAVNHCLSVVVTNNMTASFKENKAKAALGKVWAHMPHSRIILTRPDDIVLAGRGIRHAEMVKSVRQVTPVGCSISLDYISKPPQSHLQAASKPPD